MTRAILTTWIRTATAFRASGEWAAFARPVSRKAEAA